MLDPTTLALYARTADLIKTVAHPLRVAIVDYLKDGERCVADIADHLGAERSNVSRHLAVMLKAGALRCRKDGLQVYYKLRSRCVLKFLKCAAEGLKRNAREDAEVLARL